MLENGEKWEDNKNIKLKLVGTGRRKCMAQVYCMYKKCNVEIGRERIPAGTLEEPDKTEPGRYYCTYNDFCCEEADQLCALRQEIG